MFEFLIITLIAFFVKGISLFFLGDEIGYGVFEFVIVLCVYLGLMV